MLLRKKGLPDEGELVLCTVTKIFHHSVFVNLDEYDRQGLIHISEISPGRIRNLRDFVIEGKKVVCVVLRIDKEKGHIDLSLRRVNERQRIAKNNQIKFEQKAEKIIELIAQKRKESTEKLYEHLFAKIKAKYDTFSECFDDIAIDAVSLESLGIEKNLAKDLTELIKQRMKPPIVEIKGQIKIALYQPNGVEIIKETFQQALKSQDVAVKYGGAGKYLLSITSDNFKDAEKILNPIVEKIKNAVEAHDGTFEYKRIDA